MRRAQEKPLSPAVGGQLVASKRGPPLRYGTSPQASMVSTLVELWTSM